MRCAAPNCRAILLRDWRALAQQLSFGLLFVMVLPGAIAGEISTLDLGQQNVIVPVPAGFTALAGRSPTFREIWQSQDPDVQLLEVYLTPSDLNEIKKNSDKQLRKRFLTAELPQGAFAHLVDEPGFARYVGKLKAIHRVPDESARRALQLFLGKTSAPIPGISPDLDTAGASESELGVFVDEHEVMGYLTIGIKPNGIKFVVAAIVLHVRNRVLVLNCGAVVEASADIEWAKEEAKTWAHSILSAN